MSRSVSQIEQSILNQISQTPSLSGLNSVSQTAIYRLIAFIVASAQGIEEQLTDTFVLDVEAIVAAGAPMTAQWLQNQVFGFQYSSTNPQVIQLDTTTFAPFWPTIDTTLRIITRCSVTRGNQNQVNIKVAKGTTPMALASPEISALTSFVNTIASPGIIYNVISTNADKLFTGVTVYYQGAYSSTINASLLSAYNSYLANVPFNGLIQVSDLELILRAVPGVNDVILNNISARADSTSFGSGINLITNNQVLIRNFQTISGYVIDETTSGDDFISNLVTIAM